MKTHYTIQLYRCAKGKVVVTTPSETGLSTRAGRLAATF